MQLVIAAALAVVAALAEFTIVPYLKIGDAVLHPVLVVRRHRGPSRVVSRSASPGPSSGASPSTSWPATARLVRLLARSSPSAWLRSIGGAAGPGQDRRSRSSPPPSPAVVYSDAAPRLDHRPVDRAAVTDAAFGAVMPSAIYDTVLAALVRAARHRDRRSGVARRNGWTGERRPGSRSTASGIGARSGSSRSGSSTILVFGLLTTRLAYLQITNGTTLAARPPSAARRRGGDPGAPRPDLRPQGPPARLERRDLDRQGHAVRPPVQPPRRRRRAPGRAARHGAPPTSSRRSTAPRARGSIPVRIAAGRARTDARGSSPNRRTSSRACSSWSRRAAQYPDGPLLAHILGYTGPVDAAVRTNGCGRSGYLPDDLHGQGRRRGHVRGGAARDLRHPARRTRRDRPRHPGAPDGAGGRAGSVAARSRSTARSSARRPRPSSGG